MEKPPHMAVEAWEGFQEELACVNEEYLKRAFLLVWNMRGRQDQVTAAISSSGRVTKDLERADDPFPDW